MAKRYVTLGFDSFLLETDGSYILQFDTRDVSIPRSVAPDGPSTLVLGEAGTIDVEEWLVLKEELDGDVVE